MLSSYRATLTRLQVLPDHNLAPTIKAHQVFPKASKTHLLLALIRRHAIVLKGLDAPCSPATDQIAQKPANSQPHYSQVSPSGSAEEVPSNALLN